MRVLRCGPRHWNRGCQSFGRLRHTRKSEGIDLRLGAPAGVVDKLELLVSSGLWDGRETDGRTKERNFGRS